MTSAVTALEDVEICDVWASNLEEEFHRIRVAIDKYPFVAMDTEFPGIVATPLGEFKTQEDFNYHQVLCNVNMLKPIQVGFTLTDDKGNMPPRGGIWQFNLKFSLSEDMYAQPSVELLRTAGIDFEKHSVDGIHVSDFGELLTTSGLIVDKRVTWLTFHSGYDFGYLIRSIMLKDLPKEEADFNSIFKTIFPHSYDIKLLLKLPGPMCACLRGGLEEVANQLQVVRVGTQHQAGSDSFITSQTFFRIKERFFGSTWDEMRPMVEGRLFGFGNTLSETPFA